VVASEDLEKFLFPGVLPGRRGSSDAISSSIPRPETGKLWFAVSEFMGLSPTKWLLLLGVDQATESFPDQPTTP
jgi:hypothetical protein